MFDGQIVKNLLKESGRPTADLSELLYGNRKRSVSNLLGEKSNPTAHTLEQMSKFFGVPIDYFFRDEEEQKLTESTPVTVYMRTIIDTQKKLIQEQEERIKNLEKIVALREEEMTLYKSKWIVPRALGTRWQKCAKKVAHNGGLTNWNKDNYLWEKVVSFCVKKCPKNVPKQAKIDIKLNC